MIFLDRRMLKDDKNHITPFSRPKFCYVYSGTYGKHSVINVEAAL
jgi:hypothetical protein